MTEYKVFDDENDCPGTQPVGNEQQEAGERLIKVGSHRKRDRDIYHGTDERPDVALDTLESFP